MTTDEKRIALEKIAEEVKVFKGLEIARTATHAVPGEGNPDARLMFVGEAPGRNEDETGRPFVGRAGKVLTSLIEGIGLTRADVFITSVVKHRPPKNRPPKPLEVKVSKRWLDKQLAVIAPRVVVPLGRFGMEYFLPNETITTAHGKMFTLPKYLIFPVYHPAYGLRSTRALNAIKDDFGKLKKVLLKERIIK